MSFPRRLLLLFAAVMLLASCLAAQITLASPATPATAQPGSTLVALTGSGFPAGSILAAQVMVQLAPETAGSGPTVALAATGLQTVVGSTRKVTFTVPPDVLVPQATLYRVTLSGTATDGTVFTSTNFAQLTIQPVAGILSSLPAAVNPGQAAALLIRTQFGNYTQGAADATLSSGLSVGVQPIGSQVAATDAFGLPGRVIVVDPSTLLALVRVDIAATPGPRSLTVRQGPQSISRTGALTVQTSAVANTGTAVATLVSPVSPASGTPGTTTFALNATGLPSGILASQLRLLLEPAGNSGLPLTVTPQSITASSNGAQTVSFQLPSSLVLNAATDYLITLYGSTSNYGQLQSGATVLSANRAAITLGPPPPAAPLLTNVAPAAAQQGQSIALSITGQNTNFVTGQTLATLGAGISVGGAAAGQFGPVTVSSATQATGQIVLQPGAAIGPRDLSIRTGSEAAVLKHAFQVNPGFTTITITGIQPVTVRPGSSVTLSGSGFPADTIAVSNLVVTLAPSQPGAGPARTVAPASVSADSAGTRQIAFTIPADFAFTQPVNYLASVAGTSSLGITFATGIPAPLTIQPPPSLVSAIPNTGQRGQTLNVIITGKYTTFTPATTVNFGAGIALTSLSVPSTTTLTAAIAISATAIAGTRNITVVSGPDMLVISNGFNVSNAPISLTLSSAVTPLAAAPGESVLLTASNFPPGAVLASQVAVLVEPVAGGNPLVLTASSVQDNGNGTRLVRFLIPTYLSVTTPVGYFVSLSGSNSGGVAFISSNKSALTIKPAASPATISSVQPAQGTQGQTLIITITGQNTTFTQAATQVSFGAGITVASLAVTGNTSLVAQITIATAASPGLRDITVTTATQSFSAKGAFTVTASNPVLTSLNPVQGPPGVLLSVTVLGQGTSFAQGVTQVSFGVGITVVSIAVQSPVSLNAQIAIALDAVPGPRNVTATTGTQVATLTQGFTVSTGPVPLTLSNATSPATAQPGDSVTVTASNFPAGTVTPAQVAVTIQPPSPGAALQLTAAAVVDNGNNSRSVTFVVPTTLSITAATNYQVSLSGATAGGISFISSNRLTLTIQPISSAVISSVLPAQGTQGQTLTVTVTGQNTAFSQSGIQVSFGAGITTGLVTVNSVTSLTAQITVAASSVAGLRDVTVTSFGQTVTAKSAFTIAAVNPLLLSATPGQGNPGQSLSIALVGQSTNFVQATSQVSFGAGIATDLVTVNGATGLTAQITIAPDAISGPRTITVITGSEIAVLSSGFQVAAGPSGTLTIVTPGVGATGSSVPVTIDGVGTAFQPGVTVVSFGAGISPGPLTVISATRLLTTLTIDSGAGPGSRDVAVTTGSQQQTLIAGFAVIGPDITISSPVDKSFVNTTSITVNGRVNDNSASISVNGVPATNTGGQFTVAIPLSEGNNTVNAVATTFGGSTSSTSVLVNLDTTPPRVAVLTPLDGDETTEATINVAGNVNDIVVGTVNNQQAQVDVNGITAQVSNRSFVATGVPLQVGMNVVQVVARDRVGNAFTTSVKVNRIAAPLLKLSVVSGNNQAAIIATTLPQPLVVKLTDGLGSVKPNIDVFFRVAGNNGLLSASPGGLGAATVAVKADAQGQARAYWTIGSHSGAGINRVEAGGNGLTAPAVFTATGQNSGPARIVVDSGLNQTGAVGQKLPLPFVAVVIDSGNNRLGGVPVTITVRSGGGKIEGQDAVTVNSDPDGRVALRMTLGSQEGQDNNEVVATFATNSASAAVFTASGRVPKAPMNTKVSGVILDNSSQPIAGVSIKLLRLYQGTSASLPQQVGASATSDLKGYFEIPTAPVGVFKLFADGSTVPGSTRYPTLEFDITTIAGENNTLGTPVYLVALATLNQLCVDDTTGGVLTIPEAPGLALAVAPGSATFPGGAKRGCISVTPVNIDKIPMTPGFGQQPRFVVTIQPVGTRFNPPARLSIPNVDALLPGTITEMYSYDHDLASFVSIGSGRVSLDGSIIGSEPGTGVTKAGWHCGGNPQTSATVANCPVCQSCGPDGCVADNSHAPADQSPGDCRVPVCLNGAVSSVPEDSDAPTGMACCNGRPYDPSIECCGGSAGASSNRRQPQGQLTGCSCPLPPGQGCCNGASFGPKNARVLWKWGSRCRF